MQPNRIIRTLGPSALCAANIAILALGLVAVPASAQFDPGFDVNGPVGRRVPVFGRIAARGPVLRTDSGEASLEGQPWIVEYDEIGRPGDPVEPTGQSIVVSTAEYNANVQQWIAQRTAARALYGDTGVQEMEVSAFPGDVQCLMNGDPISPDPAWVQGSRWVLVADPEGPVVDCRDVIIGTSVLPDPDTELDFDGSVLIDPETFEINERSEDGHYFGVESAFFTPRPDESFCQEHWPSSDGEYFPVDPNGSAFMGCRPGRHNLIWAPIRGARIEWVSGNAFVTAVTSASGSYYGTVFSPQVPNAVWVNPLAFLGGDLLYVHWTDYWDFQLGVYAEVRWANFNPRTTSSRVYFLAQRNARVQIVGGGADTRFGYFWANFAMDAVMLRARARMVNPVATGTPPVIPLVDTDYSHSEFTQFEYTPPAAAGERRDQGLLAQISAPDLRDTDVYIYRNSDGSLIGARWGMSPREVAGVVPDDPPITTIPPGCAGRACLDFTVMTRGPVSRGTTGGSMHTGGFQPRTMSRGAHRLEVDYQSPISPYRTFLRPGDSVRVVLINRVTGYIGTISANVRVNGGQTWIGTPGGLDITMYPPNLRISARRVREDGEVSTLGSEGSGLNLDQRIEITTEWWDRNGAPLPPGLPGYTGRLARVIDGGQLEGTGDPDEDSSTAVGQFHIEPGLHTQIIHLPTDYVERAHYYIHVDGAPPEDVVDFMGRYGRRGPDFNPEQVCYHDGSGGWTCLDHRAGEGPLEQRPAVFVPFRVQVFDPGATRQAYLARAAVLRSEWEEGEPPPMLDGIRPVYAWVWSPEYQFSILDLDVDSVEMITELDDAYGMGRTGATVDYDLSDGDVDPLDPVSGNPNEARIGIGWHSVVALIDEDGGVTTHDSPDWPDVEQLALMTVEEQAAALDAEVAALDGDDFLTIQIWDDGDAGNVLWESDGALLLVGDAHRMTLRRTHRTARHDEGVPEGPPYTDDYDIVRFRLLHDARVAVRLLDGNGNQRDTLIHEQNLPAGLHHFVVDAGDVIDAGITPGSDARFTVEIVADAMDDSLDGDDVWRHRLRHQGRVRERHQELQTGQVAVGSSGSDVLLRDGSLRLSREDFEIPLGIGPALSFTRTYTNLTDEGDKSVLGPGWAHNWSYSLYAITSDDSWEEPVPQWVDAVEGQFFPWSAVPTEVRDPTVATSTWTGVQVNGTEFRAATGGWRAERGRHGTLERVGDEMVFTAEDGTRYFYPTPLLGSALVTERTIPGTDPNEYDARVHMRADGLAWRVGLSPTELILGTTGVGGGAGAGTTVYELIRPGSPEPTQLSRIEDRNGNALTIAYDGEDRIEVITDATGRELRFFYEASGVAFGSPYRLDYVTGPGGIEVDFTYDTNGYLQRVERADRAESYGYAMEHGAMDGAYNLVRATQHVQSEDNGDVDYVTDYHYFDVGELPASVIASQPGLRPGEVIHETLFPQSGMGGRPTVRTEYETSGDQLVRRVFNARGDETVFYLNASGNPVRIEEPLGRVTTLAWSGDAADGEDNVLESRTESVTGSRTRTYRFEYDRDEDGRLTAEREIDPYDNTVETTYDPRWHVPLSRRDRNGNSESWTYDDHGNTLTYRDGTDRITVYHPRSDGLLGSVREPGHTADRTFGYDDWGYLELVTSPEGREIEQTHDVRGRLRSMTDGLERTTTFDYDDLDNLILITHPTLTASTLSPEELHSLSTEEFHYDSLGRRTYARDQNGAELHIELDARGNPTEIRREPDGGTRTMQYDEEGNLRFESDWLGNDTEHTYDELNRRHVTTNRLGDDMTRTYDLGGRLTRLVDFAGGVTEYDYDDLDRVTREEVMGGGRRLDMAYYDEADVEQNLRRVTVTRTPLAAIQTEFVYNGRYDMIRRVNAYSRPFRWDYWPSGDLRSATDEDGHVREYEYDQDHLLRFERDTVDGVQFVTEHRYDDGENETLTIDPDGRETAMSYDEWGRPITSTVVDDRPDGPTGTQSYVTTRLFDGQGNLVMERDPRGITRQLLRDPFGRVTAAIDGTGARTDYEIDENDRLTDVHRPRGRSDHIEYDLEDRETVITEAVGLDEERSMAFLERDGMGHPTRVRDWRGTVTVLAYDANYLPENETIGSSPMIVRVYSRNGLLMSERDRRGETTTYAYDLLSRRTSETDPLNRTTSRAYTDTGVVSSETDARGTVTAYTLDGANRITAVHRDSVFREGVEYDRAGHVTAIIDARGNRTTFDISERGLVRTITFPIVSGESSAPFIQRRYDGSGNIAWERLETGQVRTFTYDGEDRIETSTFAGETITHAYDAQGHLEQTTTAESRVTRRIHDTLDRIERVVEGGLTTRYEYDDGGNPTQITDARGRDIDLTYDELGRLHTRTEHGQAGDADHTTTYTYDPEGAVESVTDPRGTTFVFDIDEVGRRVGARLPAGVVGTITQVAWTYDDIDRLTEERVTRTDAGGSTSVEVTTGSWDDLDRLEYIVQRGLRVDFAYDADDHRTSVSTSGGATTYTYDARGRMTEARAGGELTEFGYLVDGRLSHVARANGATTDITYEPTYRVDHIVHRAPGGAAVAESEYDYDHDGNRTWSLERTGVEVRSTFLTHDSLSRLTRLAEFGGEVRLEASGTGGVVTTYEHSGYDRSRETITESASATVRDYSYDGYGRLISRTETQGAASRTITYAYDANGNMLSAIDADDSSSARYFEYDAWDRLVAAREGTVAATPTARYEYDFDGYRIREFGTERGDVEAYWVGGGVIEERRPSATASGALVAHYHDGPVGLLRYDGGDGERSYYHQDVAGSTVALTGSGGTASATTRFDAWGGIDSQTGSTGNRQGYTGHRADSETGLIYMGARYYEPDTGLFLQADSNLGSPDMPASMNRYLYAYGNPGRYWDPDGHEAQAQQADPEAEHRAQETADAQWADGRAAPQSAPNSWNPDAASDELSTGTSLAWTQQAIDGGDFNAVQQAPVSDADLAGPRQPIRSFVDVINQAAQGAFMIVGAVSAAISLPRMLIGLGRMALSAGRWLVTRGPQLFMRGVRAIGNLGMRALRGVRAFAGSARAMSGAARGAEAIPAIARAGRGALSAERAALQGERALIQGERALVQGERAAVSAGRTMEEGSHAAAAARAEARSAGAAARSAEEAVPGSACPVRGSCGNTTFCFAAGTMVALATASLPIESVRAGDRVAVRDETACSHDAQPDMARVSLVFANPDYEWDTVYVERIVTTEQAVELGYRPGETVWYDNDEFNVGGWATVASVEPLDVAGGDGCTVSTTISHYNADVVVVRLADGSEIRGTSLHRFWSVDREDWIAARQLRTGERLQTPNGEVAVESVDPVRELIPVFNFEVDGAEQYYVGDAEVLVHNGGCDDPIRGYRGRNHLAMPAEMRADPRLVVEMPYNGMSAPRAARTHQGWLRDSDHYWRELRARHPAAFSPANQYRMDTLRVSPTNDPTFRAYFPQYDVRGLRGRTLIHHHIGGGAQAYAIPEPLHAGSGLRNVHNWEKSLGIWGVDHDLAARAAAFLP